MAKTASKVYKGEDGLGVLFPGAILLAGAVDIGPGGDPEPVSGSLGPVGVTVLHTGTGTYTLSLAVATPVLVLSRVWVAYDDEALIRHAQILNESPNSGQVDIVTGGIGGSGWIKADLPEDARLCFMFILRDED
jgi:hypothetical protein